MISEKLLIEITGDTIIGSIELSENTLIYSIEELSGTCDYISLELRDVSINISELAYKAKEWALTKGYDIYSNHNSAYFNLNSENVLDLENSYQSCIYFTNGDTLINGHFIEDALEKLSKNKNSSFSIDYESGKLNSQRYYEVLGIEFFKNKKGEINFEDLTFSTISQPKSFDGESEQEAIFKACQYVLNI